MSEEKNSKMDTMGVLPESEQLRTPEPSAQTSQERIVQIDEDLRRLAYPTNSSTDKSKIPAERATEFQEKMNELSAKYGIPISEAASEAIQEQAAVDRKMDALRDQLEIEKLHLLLLTPEQERTIRENREERRELKERSPNLFKAKRVRSGYRLFYQKADSRT